MTPPPATSNLPVVYRTSTTAFNVSFIPTFKIDSKALLPRRSLTLAFPAQTQTFATGLEDTRCDSISFITFLAALHLFCASISFTASPYTYLDAMPRNMLPLLHRALRCAMSLFCHSRLLPQFGAQAIKSRSRCFVVAVEQCRRNLVGCRWHVNWVVQKIPYHPAYPLLQQMS